jgi:hypothetical protein
MLLYSKQFQHVLRNGGYKETFKLPSDIKYIRNIGFFISNPRHIPGTLASTKEHIFKAISASLNLFNQNNTIVDFELFNNEFIMLMTDNGGSKSYAVERYFNLNKIFIPINKKNLINTNSVIIFKETDELKAMKENASYGVDYLNWKIEVEMYIEYL